MIKILSVFGTRPETIKLSPVIWEIQRHPRDFALRICVTGQHREMLNQFLETFKIKANYNLRVMRQNQVLSSLTSKILAKIDKVLVKERPDLLIVQGDTTSAFVAALAAFYHKIKIAHVEAGLRTKDRYNPFPEEINRRLVDVLTDFYFVPTKTAKDNLIKEGVGEKTIFIAGNTVIDALLWMAKEVSRPKVSLKMEKSFKEKYGITFNRKTILITGHRRESFGQDFRDICFGLKKIAEKNKDIQVVYPVHLNPNVKKPAYRILGKTKAVHLIEPLDYPLFVWLMKKARFILTDSGGIQEEAPSLNKPVLIMREKTERPEGVKTGAAKLVGVKQDSIFSSAQKLLSSKKEYQRMSKAKNPYGDGKAAKRICKVLKNAFQSKIKS